MLDQRSAEVQLLDVFTYSDVGVRYLDINERIKSLQNHDQMIRLIKRVESEFVLQCDTELGDFLNDFVLLILESGNSVEFPQMLLDLIDDYDLNSEMLMCVADDLEAMINQM
jgi:hypothetical protein